MNRKKRNIILIISLSILIFLIMAIIILINIDPEIFNYKTIVYERNKVCNTEKISDKISEKNLYEILGTSEYSDKLLITSSYDVEKVIFDSYKNSPNKLGDAQIIVKNCDNTEYRTLKARYKRESKYLVVYLDKEILIYYFDKKKNILIDYNNYLLKEDINYNLVKE